LDLHVSNFFSYHAFFGMSFYFYFLHSPFPFARNDNLERVVMNNMEFYFRDDMYGWVKCSCTTSDVEVGKYLWSVRDLDQFWDVNIYSNISINLLIILRIF
jgi:hypothetical protein